MRIQLRSPLVFIAVCVTLVGSAPQARSAALDPIIYTIKSPAPETQTAEIEASFPTDGREAIDLMMPVWAPGYYVIQNHAGRVQNLTARTPDGRTLKVEKPQRNRWWVETGGAPVVVVSYQLAAGGGVTGNTVTGDYAVL